MRRLMKVEVEKFLVRPESWIAGETGEDESGSSGNKFYWAQLEKLQAFGINIDGGLASEIAKICTPSRAVYIVFCVLSAIETLMRRGFTYHSAVQFIDWIAKAVTNNVVHDIPLKVRAEKVLQAIGFPEFEEYDTEVFYEKVLSGIQKICARVRYNSVHHNHMEMLVRGKLVRLSPIERDRQREERYMVYNRFTRREFNIWPKLWLGQAVNELSKYGIKREVAMDLIKMVLIAARESIQNDRSSNSPQQWKYHTQEVLATIGAPLNEPGIKKFFDTLVGDILAEISRNEDAAFQAVQTR